MASRSRNAVNGSAVCRTTRRCRIEGIGELSKRLRHLSSLQHSPTRRRLKRFTASEILVKYCRNHNFEIRVKRPQCIKSKSVLVADPDTHILRMQISHVLVLCTLAAVCAAQTQRPQVSDTALEDALNDKRFIQRQLKCALGEAPCDPIGKRLKTLAPLVLRGACPQCSPQETKQIQKTLSYVQRNFPQQWAKIVRQYAG